MAVVTAVIMSMIMDTVVVMAAVVMNLVAEIVDVKTIEMNVKKFV